MKEGDILECLAPIRVGMGYGPEKNGLAGVGEQFEVIDVNEYEIQIRSLLHPHCTTYKIPAQYKFFKKVKP